MAEFPTLPLFTDAYLADTRHLSAAQHGAYLLLLMMAWRLTDCCLPDEDEKLARWAAMDIRTWRANKEVVMAFWSKNEEGKFYQKRLIDERKNVSDKRSKNVAAGRKSALKRHETRSTDVAQNGNENPTIPKPKPIKEREVSKTPLSPTPEFETFWQAYPTQRRGSKTHALKAWSKAIDAKRATAEQILSGCMAYAKSEEVARGYAKGCEAWLNDDRWTFDYSPSQPAPRAGSPPAKKQDYHNGIVEASRRALKNLDGGQS